MEGKITKKGQLKAGNETYLYEIDLYTDNENGPMRAGDFSICEKIADHRKFLLSFGAILSF